eukprot:CAMPEP_0172440328 /NCGR_PEP_ID=MMETSP1065-20121228/981_1 /TAXON_ID=265537 /ORGANISM="Amphiprora paludosa, Strain CCMP125" /LENGTH=502 /DNA_ID=CAMNT_0013189115 /DNA_START=88 /DNA_END=1596 /DNA_ORIENTATION=-
MGLLRKVPFLAVLLLWQVPNAAAWITPLPAAGSTPCPGCRGVGFSSKSLDDSSNGAGLFYLRTSAQASLLTLSEQKEEESTTGTPNTKNMESAAASAPAPVAEPKIVTDRSQLPYDYAPFREFDEGLLGDLTGGRPGAIIESAKQLELKEKILSELDERGYDRQTMDDYGELAELAESDYDIDDPEAIDAATLGTWTIFDLETKFDYDWDPLSDDPDPNQVSLQNEDTIADTPKDEDGIEVGYTSFFGPSNPIDERTIVGTRDSYMIDEKSRDESRLTPQFAPDDLENEFNEDFVNFRKSLNIMETYIDPFLSEDIKVPRHVAKWHGYPEQTNFRPQNYTNNRFTPEDKKTDFDALSPFRARKLAVEMARAQNAEWMTPDVHQKHVAEERAPYEKYQTLVGTLRKGEIDPDIVQEMEPALKILGSCVELLSTWQDEETGGIVLRFNYHGLMKNRFGMKCWAESLLREECGMMNVNNVIFETGFRRRDPAYEGGDYYYGPYSS